MQKVAQRVQNGVSTKQCKGCQCVFHTNVYPKTRCEACSIVILTCEECKEEFTRPYNKTTRFCTPSCMMVFRNKLPVTPKACRNCNQTYIPNSIQQFYCQDCFYAQKRCVFCFGKFLVHRGYKTQPKLCSNACRGLFVGASQVGREATSETKQKRAEGLLRYRKNNPKAYQAWKDRMSLQRTNKFGPTVPESTLSKALGWPPLVVIKTHVPRDSGYATSYVVDVGNRELKLAIEIDGPGHSTAKQKRLDEKKTNFLNKLGWRVLRFTNKEVLTKLSWVLSTIQKSVEEYVPNRRVLLV